MSTEKAVQDFIQMYKKSTKDGKGAMNEGVIRPAYDALHGQQLPDGRRATEIAGSYVKSVNPAHYEALTDTLMDNPDARRPSAPPMGGRSRRRRGRTTAKKGGSRRRKMTSKARRH